MEDKNYDKIVFESEDGNEEFYVLEQTMLGGINYLLVTDDAESEEGGFLVLKEEQTDGEYVSYDVVEDEKILNAVIPVFDELIEDFDLEV